MPESPSSRVLQRLPTAKEAKQGCLQLRPITVTPTQSNNQDECLALPKSATVTLKVAGQTRSSPLGAKDSAVIAAPLSHLYHSQLHVQVKFSNQVTYQGSYSVDELAIFQTQIVSMDLQRTNALVDTSNNNNTTEPSSNVALQLECILQGPCRTEVTKAHQVLNTWLTLIDKSEDVIRQVWSQISPKIPNAAKKKQALLLVVPAMFSIMLPVTIGCLVVSPVVIGFCVLFFPIMIPLVVGICLFVLATVLIAFAGITGVYFSSRYGRNQLMTWWQSQTTLQDYWNVLSGPRFGLQTFYYATGPRPTPVTLTRTQMPKEKWRRLGVSLAVDGVGSFSYLLPFLGEAFDIVWAPTQTVLIMALYQHVSPNMSYVSFAEEMLPFLDVLPSATTGWMMEFGPELWEEAKGMVAENGMDPKQLQMMLFGSGGVSGANRNSTATPSRPAASRRSVPTGRPSRH